MKNNEIIVEMYQKTDCEFKKQDILNELIEINEKLCYKVANKFKNNMIDLEELMQVCRIGMYRAASKFDLKSGFKFSTFAYKSMYFSSMNYIRNNKNKLETLSLDFNYENQSEYREKTLASYITYEEDFDSNLNLDSIKKIVGEYADNRYKGKSLMVLNYLLKNPYMTNEEIGAEMGITPNHVNAIKGRIKKELRSKLGYLLEV